MLGDCHVTCKRLYSEYTGKENYLKYLDFNSLYASAMIQALPTGENRVCDDNDYSGSTSTISYIYTLDIKYNDELKTKYKEVSILSRRQKLMLISLQKTKWKPKRKNTNQMKI